MTQSFWRRTWNSLTKPHASLIGIEDIRRARMTMVFSFAMAVVCLMGSIASFISQGRVHVAVIILWAVSAICLVCYFWGRSRYYSIGATLITWMFSLCGYLVAISRPDDMSGALFSFVPLSLVLAGGLLTFWNQVAITSFNVAATMAFPVFVPTSTDMGRNAGIFMAIGLAVIVISGFRDILDSTRLLEERRQSEEVLNFQLELQRLAAQVSARFINTTANEIDLAIHDALQKIGELTKLDRSYLILYSDHLTRADCVFEWCAEGIQPEIENLQGLKLNKTSWWSSRILRGETISLSNLKNMPPDTAVLVQGLMEQGIQSILAVPITHRTEVLGYIGFDSVRAEKVWQESHIALLQMIGDVFANALVRSRTEKEAEALRLNIESQSWLAIGQARLADVMRGDLEVAQLANNVTSFLCQYLGAHTGALFLVSGDVLKLTGRYAYVVDAKRKSEFQFGENLVGEAARAKKQIRLNGVFDSALMVSSALGDAKPNQILVAPIEAEGQVFAVVELATLGEFTGEHENFLNRVSESVAIAFRTAHTRLRMNELLAQSQAQAEELRAQEEELRAANEELQAQSEGIKGRL